jgi:hypothetical protein
MPAAKPAKTSSRSISKKSKTVRKAPAGIKGPAYSAKKSRNPIPKQGPAATSVPSAAASAVGGSSKQVDVLALLRRPEGAAIADIVKATGWQAHSVRGFLAGVLRKKLNLNLISEKTDGERRYRIVDSGNAK